MTHVESHPPGTPTWVDLMTDDADAARKFYAALFDWTFEIGPAETGHYTICFRSGRRVAGIGTKPPGAPMPTVWSLYLGTADIDATAGKVKEAGGMVMMGPMDVMDQGRLAFAMDPTGAAIGLWQPMSHKGFQIHNEHGSFAWAEVMTRDLSKAVEFYKKVFGYQGVNLDGLPYVTFHLGPDNKIVAGGAMQMDDKFPKEVPAHWNVYFACDNVDEMLKKVASQGGKTLAPPFDTEYGRMAVVADAQGAPFSVIQLSAKALAM